MHSNVFCGLTSAYLHAYHTKLSIYHFKRITLSLKTFTIIYLISGAYVATADQWQLFKKQSAAKQQMSLMANLKVRASSASPIMTVLLLTV